MSQALRVRGVEISTARAAKKESTAAFQARRSFRIPGFRVLTRGRGGLSSNICPGGVQIEHAERTGLPSFSEILRREIHTWPRAQKAGENEGN